jgi:hypothetical protein
MLQGKAKTDYQREYMRRRRAGLAAAKPKPAAQADAAEIAPLKARIDELQAEVTRLRAALASRGGRPPPPPLPRRAEMEARKQAVAEEQKAKRAAARAAAELPPQEPDTIEGVKVELDKVLTQLKSARTQTKNLRGRIRWLEATADKRVRLVIPARLFREINFHLHPDRQDGAKAKERAGKCLAEFNGLKRLLDE